MQGAVGLVGGGEFEPSMEAFDRGLIEATGLVRPRVVIVLGAARRSPRSTVERRALEARAHFEALGAEVEELGLRNRADADDDSTAQAIGEADVIYFGDGRSEHLRSALDGTAAWLAVRRASERGAVLAGAGGGAAVLGDRHLRVAPRRGWPVHWASALGMCPAAGILPHYDRMPEALAAFLAFHAPRDITVVGIDERTGVVGRDGAWQVLGPGRVTIWRGRRRERLGEGDVFRL